MIKFFGEPLKEIKSKTSGKTMFAFDSKGEFITDDPAIIDRAMGFFDHMPIEPGEAGEKVKKTVVTPPITITTKDQEPAISENQPDKATGKACKHCGETHEKPVDYAQCAKKHKKEG